MSPPFPFRPLLLIATTKLGIVVLILIVLLPHNRGRLLLCGRARGGRGGGAVGLDEVACVEVGVLMALDELAQGGVARVDQLGGGQAAAVADAGGRAGLEHHLDEGVTKLALLGGLAVDPPDGRVQRGVALEPVDRVALEARLVQEVIDDLVWRACGARLGGDDDTRCVGDEGIKEGGGGKEGTYSSLLTLPRGRGGFPLPWSIR